MDTRLAQWDRYFEETQDSLQDSVRQVENDLDRLRARELELTEQRVLMKQKHQTQKDIAAHHAELKQQFALITLRRILEDRHGEARLALEAQIALVQQAGARSADAIGREKSRAEQEWTSLQRELATLADNLYLRLKSALSAPQIDALNRLLAKQVMTLGASEFEIDPRQLPQLREYLQQLIDGARITLPGIAVSILALAPQHSQRTPEELHLRSAELAQQIGELSRQLDAARALDAARTLQQQLDKALRQIEHELVLFDELTELDATSTQRTAIMLELENTLAAILAEQTQAVSAAKQFREQEGENVRQLASLRSAHKEIVQRRDSRGDAAPVFSYLADLPYVAWIGSADFALDQLAGQLEIYRNDCRRLLQLNEQMPQQIAALHACGLTKFVYMSGDETEISRIIAFAAHLPQEAEALERKARSAVVNVTACLRELRDGLLTFKSRMRDFNRLISRRQLSDLAVFKIEPADETSLVESIELLISTAEQVDDGETFSLFNHASVLDDAALNRAKQVLIGEGEARGCLRVEHLFRLEFIVGKQGRATESFTDIDSAASNGTVLMAKLITGLALLHLMQDKRHRVQAVCYLDEASALDQRNQRSLIETANDFGFALIFASPAPLVTARYCVPISSQGGFNNISRQHWQMLEPLSEPLGEPTT
jgi:hypothetical protein